MRYRKVLQVSMAITMLTSGPISAQAVFPETEFSKGAPEPRHPWREMPHNKPDHRGDPRELGDEHRNLPRNTQDTRTDRHDLQQDNDVLRRDGQELRHDRQNLQADRQHRRGSRHKANKNRRKTHDDQRDLQVDRRTHRDGPPRSIAPDRE